MRPAVVLDGASAGLMIQPPAKTSSKSQETAEETPHFATTLLPRGLSLPAAAAYSGVPVRALWRLIAEGRLAAVRVPGCRRVLILKDHLDLLLEACV